MFILIIAWTHVCQAQVVCQAKCTALGIRWWIRETSASLPSQSLCSKPQDEKNKKKPIRIIHRKCIRCWEERSWGCEQPDRLNFSGAHPSLSMASPTALPRPRFSPLPTKRDSFSCPSSEIYQGEHQGRARQSQSPGLEILSSIYSFFLIYFLIGGKLFYDGAWVSAV